MTPVRILVVDDDALFRAMLRDQLESAGHRVETAVNGDDLLAKCIPVFKPDVVVMDVVMPGENGYRLSRAIKELGRDGTGVVPKVVLLTGRRVDDEESREEVLKNFSRADAMLYKPCDPKTLLDTIESLAADPARYA